jgi:hypothetical protein
VAGASIDKHLTKFAFLSFLPHQPATRDNLDWQLPLCGEFKMYWSVRKIIHSCTRHENYVGQAALVILRNPFFLAWHSHAYKQAFGGSAWMRSMILPLSAAMSKYPWWLLMLRAGNIFLNRCAPPSATPGRDPR